MTTPTEDRSELPPLTGTDEDVEQATLARQQALRVLSTCIRPDKLDYMLNGTFAPLFGQTAAEFWLGPDLRKTTDRDIGVGHAYEWLLWIAGTLAPNAKVWLFKGSDCPAEVTSYYLDSK